jgi:hypothetical protein
MQENQEIWNREELISRLSIMDFHIQKFKIRTIEVIYLAYNSDKKKLRGKLREHFLSQQLINKITLSKAF